MKKILEEISSLAVHQSPSRFTDEQKGKKWLGSTPASYEEIKSAENRLEIELPDDYKKFLLITNGFFTPCDSTEPTFEPINKIDYLKNIDTYLLEVWNEGVLVDIGSQLNRAIVIGGINDEQYFFLIPPEANNLYNEWQYWKFANWIPGEEPFKDLDTYFQSVLDFMKDVSEKS